ncbi:MAG: hypothetical protein R3320_08600 [Nitriliruptorales bacterium]|nr:hypothetical protein [Nitriliruptorales bacterium]
MANLTASGVKALRRLAGKNTALERYARRQRNRARFALRDRFRRRDVYVFRNATSPRFGVYAFGACDLWSVVGAGELLAREFRGTGAVLKVGGVSRARTDILLQTLKDLPAGHTAQVTERLGLSSTYFEPELFSPSFSIPDHAHVGEFAKQVVILSIAADLTRSIYEHKELGFLVDPGGWWLEQSMDRVLASLDSATWFARTFRKVGRLGVDDFHENMGRLIPAIRSRTGAEVLVLNSLVVEPGHRGYSYHLVTDPHVRRRHEFNLALADLARRLDFGIVDVDRLCKSVGVSGQADFVHFTSEQKARIAQEVAAICHDRGLLRR